MAKKKASGGAVMKAAGREPIMVSATPEQKKSIRVAAAKMGVPMSKFLLETGLREAERISKKS